MNDNLTILKVTRSSVKYFPLWIRSTALGDVAKQLGAVIEAEKPRVRQYELRIEIAIGYQGR